MEGCLTDVVHAQVPLLGFIGRLDFQKGADLVLGAAAWLLQQDVQLVCLGTGEGGLEVCSKRACQTHQAAELSSSLPWLESSSLPVLPLIDSRTSAWHL